MLEHLSDRLLYPIAERVAGRRIRAKADLLRQQFQWPFAERRRWAAIRLAEQLARAGGDVPYYRELFARLRFQPDKLARDLRYLDELPFLTKDILREQGIRMLSERFHLADLHVRKTGGSTGPSTLIYYSQDDLDWTAATNRVCQEWAGKRSHMTELHLASRFPETFPWKDRLRERIKCRVLNRVNVFTDNFEPAGLDQIWQAIRKARPYLVQGHPSTMYALATHLRNAGVDARGQIRVFESTGEVLDSKKRETIESVFGCRAIDRFGNAEFGILAYERGNASPSAKEHRLTVLDSIVWPEQLEQEGGTELVFTALRNDCLPLVRYRTGDLAKLETHDDGFYLKNIVGRVHDVVRIGRHRYPTHYLQDLLDRLGGVDEFQVEERVGSSLLRLVVPDAGQRVAISRRIEQWWGDDVTLEFTDFDGLTRCGWQSKFRYLVAS